MSNACRERRLRDETRGAIMVIGLFMAVMLVGFLYYLIGVGDTIVYRERMQDAADAGAFSAAVVHARGMNILALINMIMAAALAVLIALKVVETLIIAGMVVAAGLAFVTFGASLAAIPPLKNAQQGVRTAHDRLQPHIFKILEIGHDTAPVVRKAMPVAAQARALTIVRSPAYRPPVNFGFGWPIHQELPTTDGDYGELCNRAGRNVGTIAGYPFAELDLPGVAGWIEDKTGDLAQRYSRWFCSGEGEPPEITDEVDVAIPELDISRDCRTCGDGGSCTPEHTERVCSEAEDAERASYPDEQGLCAEGAAGAGCRERVDGARDVCRVGEHSKFLVQERTIRRWFWRDAETGEVRFRDDELRTRRRTLESRYPCGWTSVQPVPIDTDPTHDVCGRDLPPAHPGYTPPTDEENAVDEEYTYYAVLFGCTKKVERTFRGGAATRPENTSEMAPQRIVDDVELGDDRFQIRYVVFGGGIGTKNAESVRVASWGRGSVEPESWQQLFHYAGRFSVAQAEYYWGGDPNADREEWLWSMRWRARLRRFRMPADDADAARSQCHDFIASSPSSDPDHSCNQMAGSAGFLGSLIAH